MENGQEFVIYHQHGDVVTVLGAHTVVDGYITFEVDGFSKIIFVFAEKTVSTEDLQDDINKGATVNTDYGTTLWIVEDPSSLNSYLGTWHREAKEGEDYKAGIEFIITDAYVSNIYPYGIFYKVQAINEEDLLSDTLKNYPWVFFRYQDDTDYYNALVIEDVPYPEIPADPDLSADLGKHAHWTYSDDVFVMVTEDVPTFDYGQNSLMYDLTEFSTDFTLKIDGFKVVTEVNEVLDEDTYKLIGYSVRQSLWYKVSVVGGSCTSEFQDGWWVFQNYITEGEAYPDNMLTLFDAPVEPEEPVEPSVGVTVDGEPVTEVSVSLENKVTVTATPNVEGTTTYQWQILISKVNMWINIGNQNAAECVINYGMVANALDAEGKAHIRCVTNVDGVEIISDPIAVVITEDAGEVSFQAGSSSSSEETAADTAAANSDVMPTAEEDGKYIVTVYYYVGDSTVYHRDPLNMEFGVNEPAKTTSFPIPEREGYTAYYFATNANTGIENGQKYTDAEYVLENFKPTSDMAYYVRYYPNNDTPYTVKHYVQNIYDDGYTLKETVTHYGTTDANVPAFDSADTLAIDWESEGFYATPYHRLTIAADGSTVIEIHYDRYMYLLMFDLGEGGMGVDPVYARVGFEYTVENEPTRRGYLFNGWRLENGTEISKESKPYQFTIPANESTVTAVWTKADTTYTVVYWKENAEPDKDANGNVIRDANGDLVYSYSYWAHAEEDAVTGTIVDGTNNIVAATNVTDEEAKYFTFNSVATDQDVVVKGNGSTVVNVYYLRNYYEIYFYAKGTNNPLNSCAVTPHTHGDGTCETYPICLKTAHEHDETCRQVAQICGGTLHTHDDACCTKEVHTEHTGTCCSKTVHANHTTSCYNNVGAEYTGNRVNGANPTGDGYVYRYRISNNNYARYIYINGKWYNYNVNSGQTGTIVQPSNCSGIHTHGDGSCTCAKPIHTHGDGSCTYDHQEHKQHTDACYEWSCGAYAHVHTDACYSACIKPEHSHGTTCTNSNRNLLKIIRAKYDADISAEWPVANDSIPGLRGFAYWSGNGTDQSSRVVTMNGDWAKGVGSSAVKVNANYNSTKYHLNYWFEDFDQESTTTSDTRKWNSTYGKYYVLSEKYTQDAYYGNTNGWGYKVITGMTREGTGDAPISNGTANLYYSRNKWTLTFESDNKTVYTENQVPFEKPLSYYVDADGKYISDIIPTENPVDKPANGYYFEGWYTTRECFPGTKVDFSKLTMPNNHLTLFANWAPRTHQIEFFFDSSLTTRLDEAQFPTQKILHNEYGADPGLPGHPMDFEAVVWFYKDANGEEKAFNFDMPVTEDMKLYPKWRTNVYIKYEVRYKIYDAVNKQFTDIEIADRLYGEELYGESVTVEPKGTEEFYEAYKQAGNGYFPLRGSHSIIMGEQECSGTPPYEYCVWDEETSTHIFTFYYVNGPIVPYRVEYHEVDADGNFVRKLIDDKYVADNYYAKVVENAAIIPGFMPDEAQKTIYIVHGEENKIIFTYKVDENASFYRVSHWIKKYGSDKYELIQDPGPVDYASRVGDIISSFPALEIPGVEYTHTVINPSNGVVGKTENGNPGLTVDLYYEEEPVKINYVVKPSGTYGTLTLYEETVGAAYGTVVGSQATPASEAYEFIGWYSDEACTKPVSYDTTNNKFGPSKVDGVHVAATYYAKFEELEATINYVAVGPEGVDPTGKFGVSPQSETIKVSTGKTTGSTAAVTDDAYRFAGWYSDANCTKLITLEANYVPTKAADALWTNATYYAKFEYNITNLTIVKSGAEAYKDIDPNQTFIFNIKGKDVNVDVTVHGSDWTVVVEGLTVGETYTVTEKTNWSWRYDCTGWEFGSEKGTGSSAQITLEPRGNRINFTNERSESQWLDGDSWCDNEFGQPNNG